MEKVSSAKGARLGDRQADGGGEGCSEVDPHAMAVLALLDTIKPVMLLKAWVIEHALLQFEKRRYNDRQFILENFDMSLEEARNTYFSSCFESCNFLFKGLAFYSSVYNHQRVKLLDALTLITLFMNSVVDVKLRYLFNWYNFAKSGLMTEYEFQAFLVRASQCVASMRLINKFELPLEDAAHFALLARSYVDKNEIKLKAFIGMPEFVYFFVSHPTGKGFFSFFNVIQRLVISIDSLDRRSISVHKIVQEKYANLPDMQYVPKMDLFALRPTSSAVVIIDSSPHSITVAFEPVLTEDDRIIGCHDVYMLLEKVVELPFPQFDLPHTLQGIKDVNLSRRALPVISRRISLIPTYRKKCISVSSLSCQPGNRVMSKFKVDSLDADASYQITIYTKSVKYLVIEGRTMASPDDKDLESGKEMSICILPASVDSDGALAFMKTSPTSDACQLLVFTGVLLSFERELRRYLVRLQHSYFACSPSVGNFVSAALIPVVKTLFSGEWAKKALELFHSRSFNNCQISKASASFWKPVKCEKQLLFAPSSAYSPKPFITSPVPPPTSSSSLVDQEAKSLGNGEGGEEKDFLTDVLPGQDVGVLKSFISSLFEQYTNGLAPDKSFLHVQETTVIFVGPLSHQMSVEGLASFLSIYDTESHSELADSIIASKKVVVVIPDPFMLFGEDLDALLAEEAIKKAEIEAEKEAEKGKPRLEIWQTGLSTAPSESKEDTKAEREKLRGKHELMHGEHRYKSKASLPSSFDQALPFGPIIMPDFNAPDKSGPYAGGMDANATPSLPGLIVTKLLKLSQAGKAVDLVCTSWVHGCNLTITSQPPRDGGRGGLVTIDSLMGTPSQHANEAKQRYVGDKFVLLLRSQLADDVSITKSLNASELRAAVLHCGETPNEFVPVVVPILPSSRLVYVPKTANIDEDIPDSEENQILKRKKRISDPSCRLIEPVRLLKSPKIISVSDRDVLVEVFTSGFGRIACTLYEVPFSVIEVDVLSLLLTERACMRRIARKSHLCNNKTECRLQFFELRAATSLCLVIDLVDFDEEKQLPHFCLFKTLADSSCNVFSAIVAPINIESKRHIMFTSFKIKEMRNMVRSLPGSVFLLGLHNNEAVERASYVRDIRVKNSLRAMQKLGDCILAAEAFNENSNNDVIVSIQGQFCQILMKKESKYAFDQLLAAIKQVAKNPNTFNIVLFMRKPLCRYLRFNVDKKKYEFDGCVLVNKRAVRAVVYELLSWKATGNRRLKEAENSDRRRKQQAKEESEQLGESKREAEEEDMRLKQEEETRRVKALLDEEARRKAQGEEELRLQARATNEIEMALTNEERKQRAMQAKGDEERRRLQEEATRNQHAKTEDNTRKKAAAEANDRRNMLAELSDRESAALSVLNASFVGNSRDCVIVALDTVKHPVCVVFQMKTLSDRTYGVRKMDASLSDLPMPDSLEAAMRRMQEKDTSTRGGDIPDAVRVAMADLIVAVETRNQDALVYGRFEAVPSFSFPVKDKAESLFQTVTGDDSSGVNKNSSDKFHNSTVLEERSIIDNMSTHTESLLHRQICTSIRHVILPSRYSDINTTPPSMDSTPVPAAPLVYVAPNAAVPGPALKSDAAPGTGPASGGVKRDSRADPLSDSRSALLLPDLIFPVGTCPFGALVQYEVLEEIRPTFEQLLVLPPQTTYYGSQMRILSDEPVLYSVDITSVPMGYADPMIDLSHHSLESHVVAADTQLKNNFHLFVAKCVLHDIDFFDIVFGPVLGAVTATSALLSIEVNRPMDTLQCVVKAFTGGVADVIYTKRKIKAFCVVTFEIKNLMPGGFYEVSFPILKGKSPLLKFRTVPQNVPYVDIVVTGKDSMLDSPLLSDMAQQIISHQLPVLRHTSLLGRYCYGDRDLLPTDPGFTELALQSGRSRRAFLNDMWLRLAAEQKASSAQPLLSFHMDSQALLPVFVKTLIDSVVAHALRLELPVREASATGALFFYQFEELLKDTFRLVTSLPMIKDGFSNGASMLLFRSSYLFPLNIDLVDKTKFGSTDEKEVTKLLQVIRKVYEQTIASYMGSLYNFKMGGENPDPHHTKYWKCDQVLFALIDNASGRLKLKGQKKPGDKEKEKEEDKEEDKEDKEEEEEEEEEKEDKASKKKDGKTKKKNELFSIGFFDKNQWKIVKALCDDATNFHIVIVTEYPIVSVEAIPINPLNPVNISLAKGQSIPWRPDYNDLLLFFDFWMGWMMPRGPLERIYKDVTFLSMHDFPYSTVIQDVSTGVKIHQVCAGRFNPVDARTKQGLLSQISLSDVVISGKIGRYRYNHSLGSADLTFDSSRDVTHVFNQAIDIDKVLAIGSIEPILSEAGFGKIRIWMDSWKSKTIYQTLRAKHHENKSGKEKVEGQVEGGKKPRSEANLVVGPITGLLRLFSNDESCSFPMLIEVDGDTVIEIEIMNSFTNEIRLIRANLVANCPQIVEVGPLEVDARYQVTLLSGVVASPFSKLILSTNVNWSESNIAAINCDSTFSSDWQTSSEFSRDLINRCNVPFHGITMVAHMNLTPSLSDCLQLLEKTGQAIEKKLQTCRDGRMCTVYVHGFLQSIYGTLREYYRALLVRPSYRELLRSAFHAFIPTRNPVDYLSMSNERFSFRHLLFLMIARLNQEYFDQLNYPDEVVFLAYIDQFSLSLDDVSVVVNDCGEVVEQEMYRSDGRVMLKVCKIGPGTDAVHALFKQWVCGMMPVQGQWKPLVMPNKRATLELVPFSKSNYKVLINEQIRVTTNLDLGVRIMVLGDDMEATVMENILQDNSDLLLSMQTSIKEWNDKKEDRKMCFISANGQNGTRKYSLMHPKQKDPKDFPVILGTIDSYNRSNGYQKTLTEMAQAQVEASVKKGKKGEGGGKSKKAQLKKEQELRQARDKAKAEFVETMKKQRPDGYLIVECRTHLIQSQFGNADVLSLQFVKIVSSALSREDLELLGEFAAQFDPNPTYFDYLQIPDWILKFFPNKGGVFVQDDVLFVMRNKYDTKDALAQIESNEMFIKLCEMYEKSRLSELSRPPELREVNIEIPELIPIFIRDLIAKIWDDVVPEGIKFCLVNFKDDFLRSMILSRSLPDVESLSSADAFASGIQRAMMFAMTLKLAYKMKVESEFQYVLEIPEEASYLANNEVKRNKWRAQIKKEAMKKEIEYDEATLDFMVAQKEADEGAESDIDELIKDGASYEQYLADKEREEEEKQAAAEAEEEKKNEKRRLEEEKKREMEEQGDDPNSDAAVIALVEANEKCGIEATTVVLDQTVDYILELSWPIIIKEMQISQEAAIGAAILKEQQEKEKAGAPERLNESYGHISRMAKYRLEVRNRFGPTLTHFQPS